MPIVSGKTGRATGIVKLNAHIVFFYADGVRAEVFVVNAVEAGADASLHDQIVGNDLVEKHKSGVMAIDLVVCFAGRTSWC
ncbi:hypothetical protein D3C83_79690 [compost metagenome]